MTTRFETLSTYHDNLLLESAINEGVSLPDLKKILSKVKNVKAAYRTAVKRFNASTGQAKRGLAAILIVLMYMSGAPGKMDPQELVPQIDKLSSIPTLSVDITPADLRDQYLKDPRFNFAERIKRFKTSEEALQMIKDHELLKLTAYALGDRMVTIGWGHAEPIKKTKMVPGETTISKEKAIELFKKDIKTKEDGVKRMLIRWVRENSIDPDYITQSMFDSMVSMSYNMGNRGLERTDFMADLKGTDLSDPHEVLKTAEKIKNTKVSKRFPGLKKRRKDEYNLFVKDTRA